MTERIPQKILIFLCVPGLAGAATEGAVESEKFAVRSGPGSQ